MGRPPPLHLEEVSDRFDRVQLTRVGWEEPSYKSQVEIFGYEVRVVHAEVVHHYISKFVPAPFFEILNELKERVRVVAALKYMSEEEAVTNA